ncbi:MULTISPECIES: hypothetical protein [unclassified Streptomyces]|uniref:hypothetical protein n=1 Tax=unclassified Streptomyces TaxID=2593676 RepID=UPI002E381383|nr:MULTISPECIES: hypothetical protein [unclassified Streptomyces]WUC68024.1 hypothetical protein OG861_29415 [Streptomyces sp. NBC_00539]
MSAQEERNALTLPPALYDQALHLLRESPDGVPPPRGFSLPREPAADGGPLAREEAANAVREALRPLPDGLSGLHRRFVRLGIRAGHGRQIRSAVAEMPLPAEQLDAARALGRQLTRSGTTVATVTAGVALLRRCGEPEDVPYLSVLGLFREFNRAAVEALDILDRPSAAVVWLALYGRDEGLQPLIRALRKGNRQAVHTALVAYPASPRHVSSVVARRVAEACRLADLLDHHCGDTDLLARAGRLLVRIGSSYEDPAGLRAYRDALRVYDSVVTRADLLPPTLDNAAMLLSLALNLSSGTAALLDWPPGRRAALLDSLGRLRGEPRWVMAGAGASEPDQRLRAGWIRRTGRRPFERPEAPGRLRIEVVAGDPADREPVETRILIDGRPLVPAVFGLGPAHRPEYLLDEGMLRAAAQPREVQLAEAGCTEGCCGALYVTIRRDGDHVVWENWRRSQTVPAPGGPAASELPDYRFDASAYDAEIARAETDRSWSWPARTTARLIEAGLRENPELLGRWDARRGRISSGFRHPDTTEVTFWYVPGPAAGRPERADSPLQFCWVIPDDGTPPEAQAAAALRRLAEEDPKTYGRVCGGSPERAAELGFSWPDSA